MLKSGKYPVLIEYAIVQVENGSTEQTNINLICRLQHSDPVVRISIPATIVLPPGEETKLFIQGQVLEYVALKYGVVTTEKFLKRTADRPLSFWQDLWLPNLYIPDPEAIAKEMDYVLNQED